MYEKCGDSLGNTLYDLKGERVNNEKLYRVNLSIILDSLQIAILEDTIKSERAPKNNFRSGSSTRITCLEQYCAL